jgi:hypothetical protein
LRVSIDELKRFGTASAASKHGTSMIWIIVATVCIGSFMGQLDASITQLVLPALEREFADARV